MNATVEKLVRIAFQDLREDPEVLEIREAVMRDCQERFEEMTGNGYTEDEAIAAIVESLQGMEEMMQSFQSTEKTEEKTPSRDEQIFQERRFAHPCFHQTYISCLLKTGICMYMCRKNIGMTSR